MSTIRKVTARDLDGLKAVIDSSELFPAEYLDDMIAGYLQDPDSPEIWLTASAEPDQPPLAVAFCAPEKMTEGTYNLYLIAVSKERQGRGVGGKLIQHLEALLRREGHRILIVETSALPEFARTRDFYLKHHYVKEAVIRDFYQEGEGKVVFWKKL